jgi:hypothetical protein
MTATPPGTPKPSRLVIHAHPPGQPAPVLLGDVIDLAAGSDVCDWFPDFPHPGHRPMSGGIRLRCYRTRDGHRLFLPDAVSPPGPTASVGPETPDARRAGWAHLVGVAGAAGLALREAHVSGEAAHCAAVFLNLHEYARGMSAYCGRQFRTRKDLVYPGPYGKDQDVLPDDLRRVLGSARTLAADAVIDAGREEAAKRGNSRASDVERWIPLGLHAAAAKASPRLPGSREERAAMIRSALFLGGAGSLPAMTPAHDLAYARFEELYRGHIRRGETRGRAETADEFREWHAGRKTNVLRLVAEAVEAQAGLSHDQARDVIADLGWMSFEYARVCVSAAMLGWLADVPEGGRLTGPEERLFSLMYVGVPETAGFPLAVLYDRLDLIEPWLAEVVRDPDRPPAWDVLYGLLTTYADLAGPRRDADRDSKRRTARTSLRIDPGHKSATRPTCGTAADDPLNKAAERVRVREGITCPRCPAPDWSYEWADSADALALTILCRGCRTEWTVEVDPSHLPELGG